MTPLLKSEIHMNYEKKRRQLTKDIMIDNIKYATNHKISLMSTENLRSVNSGKIRSKFKSYRSSVNEVREFPKEKEWVIEDAKT